MSTNDTVGWCEIRVEIDEAGARAYLLGWGAGTRPLPHDVAEPSAEAGSSSPSALDPLPWAE
jgi:hypothetical protein